MTEPQCMLGCMADKVFFIIGLSPTGNAKAWFALQTLTQDGLQGALALLDIETGVESLSEVEAGAAFLIMLFLTAAEPKPAK